MQAVPSLLQFKHLSKVLLQRAQSVVVGKYPVSQVVHTKVPVTTSQVAQVL